VAGRVLIAVVVLLVVGFLGWLRPFEAGPDALAALHGDGSVSVVDTPTTIELAPVGAQQPTVGLVFYPGARVDSRAYAALLRPIAEAGYLVVILKEPFGLAVTQIGQAAGPIADHPEITTWAVGGHSLGGVAAASFAADNPATVSGLLLWGSYPNGDLSNTGVQVASISGSNDGLTTPADIEKSKANLPPDTTFTVIDGGVHAFFADYGEQPGDGQPTIDRDEASVQIVKASTAFLDRLAQGSTG
jgi:pimeloyl-ACP methyl ester carboxylesterase